MAENEKVSANATKLENLFDPQVIGVMLEKKLIPAIKFAPLANVYTNLVGQAGSKVLLPYYNYIGDASTVEEYADIPINKLVEQTTPVTIHKIGNGVQLSDEAILSGYGDPVGQAVTQLALSIATVVDDDLVAALNGNETNVYQLTGDFSENDVADALVKFGEDIDGNAVIVIDANAYATLRKSSAWMPASEMSAQIIMSGVVGQIYGCQVVVSDRVKDGNFHIVKQGALAIYMKRDTLVETDRDILNSSNVIVATKHFATYLQDATKAIVIKKKVAVAG